MPRILLLITDLEIGGTPTVVRELALRLRRGMDTASSNHVHVACLAPVGPVAHQIQSAGIPVTPLNAKGPRDLAVFPRFSGLLAEHGFDTVFSFLVHANAVAAASTPFRKGVRYIQSIQTTQPDPRWHWRVQRLVHRFAETIVVPSESVAEAAVERSAIPRSKIQVIPNAVEPAEFAGIPPITGDPRPFPIGFIGRLDPIKRIPDLLEAVYRLAGLVHLHVFGDGPQRPDIEHEIANLAISHLVTLHGATPRPHDALARLGLLVLPSAAEGFGLVLIEAMAAGVPVLATNAPGIRDVVTDNQNGLLVPVGDAGALARSIERLITDPQLRARLVEGGKQSVQQRFSWTSVIEQYRALLRLT
jgi:glycosyltransferase involved in cell wall biosynthesis